jgi:histidyl-tRNA synthetase
VDVFLVLDTGAPRERVAVWLAELRRRGVAADTDYAGRSLKGQLTQAGRSGASTTVVVGPAEATIRRAGTDDTTVGHDALLDRLLA